MRQKRVFCAVLALLLSLAAPGYAAEADPEGAPSPEAETVEAAQPELSPEPIEDLVPEDPPAPGETPASEESPAPEESPVPEESPELEKNPVLDEPPAQEKAPLPVADDLETVKIIVPANGQIVINPYGLPVETAAGTSTEQIVSETLDIVNDGEVPVIVSASAAGRVSERSSAVYVSAPPPADTREKEIFLYAEFLSEDGQWAEGYSGKDNQILIGPQTSETKDVLTLEPGGSGMFRLFGLTSVTPDDPWGAEDKICVTFTFTFKVPEEVLEAQDTIEEPSEPEEAPELEETPVPEVNLTPGENPVPEGSPAPAEIPITEIEGECDEGD